jgi:hypothetical protein
MSILQWTSRVVTLIPSTTVSKHTHDFPISPADVTWSQYRVHLTSVLPHKELAKGAELYEAPKRNQHEEYILATKDYYVRAESILRAHGAALSAVPQVAETGRAVNPQESGYVRHTKYSQSPIPIHLKVFYDELFEACWTGDNTSIQELCLPKEEKESQEPIQISVQTTPLRNGLGWSIGTLISFLEFALSHTYLTGWTPLLVALHRRHWETARLVLAIAIAQYQPPESKGSTFADTPSTILDGTSPTSLHRRISSFLPLQMTQMRKALIRTKSMTTANRMKSTSLTLQRGHLLFVPRFPRIRCSKPVPCSSALTASALYAILFKRL